MDQTNNGIVPKQGWSWGAFALNAYFLIAVKRYKFLWWFLLAVIPFVNIVFWIVFLIYLGIKGHEIGAGGTQFANQSEYDGYMKGTDHAGKVAFFIGLAAAVLAIIFVIVGISLGGFHGMNSTTPTGPGGY